MSLAPVIADEQAEVVEASERDAAVAAGSARPRAMMDLATDILVLARVTNTYGWDQGGPTVDASAAVSVGAKPISGRQWLDAMGLASEIRASSAAARDLGVPEALAHPDGAPGLVWKTPDAKRSFTLVLRTGAVVLVGARHHRLCWERRDERGVAAGESPDVRDLLGALLSAFGKGG